MSSSSDIFLTHVVLKGLRLDQKMTVFTDNKKELVLGRTKPVQHHLCNAKRTQIHYNQIKSIFVYFME